MLQEGESGNSSEKVRVAQGDCCLHQGRARGAPELGVSHRKEGCWSQVFPSRASV